MPDFPSRADGAVPPAGDSALDELLTAGQTPQDIAAGLQPVAAALAALRAGPVDAELAGQASALAEFRSTVRVSHRADRSRARSPVPFLARLNSKLAIITTATAVAVTGTVAAAYVGVLPGPLQRAAHDVFAAPPAASRPAPAAFRAHRLHTRPAAARPLPTGSAGPFLTPVTGLPGWRHGPAGSPRKHDRHKRHGHHQGHRSHRATGHEGMSGDQNSDRSAARSGDNAVARHPGNQNHNRPAPRRGDHPKGHHQGSRNNDRPVSRRGDHPKAHHKGSRLQSPLPSAAAFPSPPAGPDRPGAGGR
jgi:hypothetical protein